MLHPPRQPIPILHLRVQICLPMISTMDPTLIYRIHPRLNLTYSSDNSESVCQ